MSEATRDPFHDRKPPMSEDAEHAVLSAMLMDPAAIATVTTILDAAAFYVARHRRIFSAMVRIYERRVTLDPLTLSEELIAAGELEAAGGKEYIGFLVDAAPTSANIEYHADIVREKAQRRAVIETLTQGVHGAFDPSVPVRDLAASISTALNPLAADRKGDGFVHVKDDLWPLLEAIESRAAGAFGGATVPTGYPEIDTHSGGLQRGELAFLCGVPSCGKTAAALNMMLNVARDAGLGAAAVSAETTRRKLIERTLSRMAQVNFSAIRSGELHSDEFGRLARAAGDLAQLPIWMDQSARPTISSVAAKCRHLKQRHPTLSLIVVDFIQLLTVGGRREENKALDLTDISYVLQGLAKELDVLLLAMCQVDAAGVEARENKRPQERDLRWSQAMREAAAAIGLCYRDQRYHPNPVEPDMLEINFAKMKDAEPFTVKLNWTGQYMWLDSPLRRAREKALV